MSKAVRYYIEAKASRLSADAVALLRNCSTLTPVNAEKLAHDIGLAVFVRDQNHQVVEPVQLSPLGRRLVLCIDNAPGTTSGTSPAQR